MNDPDLEFGDDGRPTASVDFDYPGELPTAEAIAQARREAGDIAARNLLRLLYAATPSGLLLIREVLQHIVAQTSSVTAIAGRLKISRKTFYAHQRRVQEALGNSRHTGEKRILR